MEGEKLVCLYKQFNTSGDSNYLHATQLKGNMIHICARAFFQCKKKETTQGQVAQVRVERLAAVKAECKWRRKLLLEGG